MSEIVVLCEGATEKSLKDVLKNFLDEKCKEAEKDRVRLTLVSVNGASELLKVDRLSALVNNHLKRSGVMAVVGLLDVVGPSGRRFKDGGEAIKTLKALLPDEKRFHAHAAQHDLEAWLLPYWDTAQKKAGHKKALPGPNPEKVNHDHPPSWHLQELFRLGGKRYDKARDAAAILRGQDLTLAAAKCPQFKAFLNTLLNLSGCAKLS